MRDEKLYWYSGEHLAYEIDMCARAARLLLAFVPERHSLTNVLLESYALHLRNLIQFVYWRPKMEDVSAEHYVRDIGAWTTARGTAPVYLAGVKDRADKQVAHLTEKRFTGDHPEKHWRPVEEIAALLPGLHLFLKHARPELVHDNVRHALERLAAMAPPQPAAESGRADHAPDE